MVVVVELLDGQVAIGDGDEFHICSDGELVVTDREGCEVASFLVGEWLNASQVR